MTNGASNSSGATIVEAALVFPVLLLLLFGVIQWGLIFAAQVTLRAAAASTAREYAVIGTMDCATLRDVTGIAIAPLLDASDTELELEEWVPTGQTREMRRVRLVHKYNVLLPFVVPGATGGAMRLRADAAMRCEQSCGAVGTINCPSP